MTEPADDRSGPRGREALFDAVVAGLAEAGYAQLTVEGVATAAGVHKATIYRWWPSKSTLVADALAARMHTGPVPDTGSVREDLTAWLVVTIANYTTSPAGAAMPALISDLAATPGGVEAFRAAFLAERRAGCTQVLHRAMDRGEVTPDLDVELFLDALAGTVFYRALVSGQPVTDDLAERLTELLISGAGAQPASL